jgi:hypothetical protein
MGGCYFLLVIVSVGLQFDTENGGNMILRNITKLLPYDTALIPEDIILKNHHSENLKSIYV